MGTCNARHNRTIPCDGDYVPSEGCCLRHSVLFDYWIADCDGARVYETNYPRNWKRSKFHAWLDTLTVERAEQILNS